MADRAAKAQRRARKKPPHPMDGAVCLRVGLTNYCGFAAAAPPAGAAAGAAMGFFILLMCFFIGFFFIGLAGMAWSVAGSGARRRLIALGEGGKRRERDCGAYPNRGKFLQHCTVSIASR